MLAELELSYNPITDAAACRECRGNAVIGNSLSTRVLQLERTCALGSPVMLQLEQHTCTPQNTSCPRVCGRLATVMHNLPGMVGM